MPTDDEINEAAELLVYDKCINCLDPKAPNIQFVRPTSYRLAKMMNRKVGEYIFFSVCDICRKHNLHMDSLPQLLRKKLDKFN